ncbi:MAG: carboxypeptidase-like regulatory domain-containing protein [Gelidibacter sp.]
MKNQFSLNIKTPCSEKFDQFSPTPQGGFCGSCEKEVIDFTNMDTKKIANYFRHKETQNTCGRFNSSQLKVYNQNRMRASLLSGITLACLSLFSLHSVQAQMRLDSLDRNPSEIKTSTVQKHLAVKGNVSDGNSPLPGVNIILEGTTIGTQTNFDGDFEFPKKLKKDDILVFSYVGLTSQKVVITDEDATSTLVLKISMDMDASILMGKVAVKKVYKSKRN